MFVERGIHSAGMLVRQDGWEFTGAFLLCEHSCGMNSAFRAPESTLQTPSTHFQPRFQTGSEKSLVHFQVHG
jgi:hypothetical protein